MAREPEERFRDFVERDFGVRFVGARQLGEWGTVDNVAILDDGRWVILEVEASQKHPCTNVLKVWPYLDVNLDTRVVFVHGFYPDSPGLASNRGRLSTWLGERLSLELEWQYQYVRVVYTHDGHAIEGAAELRRALAEPRTEPGCLGSLFRKPGASS